MDNVSLRVDGPTLTLRYATVEDAPALFALASDAEVTRFFSWGPYERVEQAESYIAGLPDRRDRGETLDLLIIDRERGPIGVTGLSELSRRDRRCILGTWLGRPWWGTGANAESKALVARLAFDVLGMQRLGAYTNPDNLRSQRALEKLGFAREGKLAAFHRHGDRVHDVLVYGLLRGAWERSPMADVSVRVEGEPPPAFVVSGD
ncbi:MAG TPA: GNAT family N-acetyltransferase [Solirubrobacteraceae bacterium]|nr:GNAT family N-acetyltransferase [Solirubrobacteraceae bacterium]